MKALEKEKIFAVNRKARYLYSIIDVIEAGISLLGSEVKSVREGNISLSDSYAVIKGEEVFLHNLHISAYKNAGIFNHDPVRVRKLLLKKREIRKLYGKVSEKGITLVPLSVYLKSGKIKIELAMAKGKKPHKGEGHRGRLRERFLASGLDGFHDYEVIELLLTLATPRKDCKEQAKATLKRFKTFQGVLEATPEQLQEIRGIGPKNVFGIKFVRAVAERYLRKKLIKKDPIRSSKELFDYLYHTIRDKKREVFKVVFLDAQNRIISIETLFEGTLTASSIYPRELVQAALRHHAAGLFLVHNHPSGEPRPSREDRLITRQLVHACRVTGIAVHEHLIIGDNTYFSFADHGYIAEMNREYDAQYEA